MNDIKEDRRLNCWEKVFLRVHQSHLARSEAIKRINKTDGSSIELVDGTQVPISKKCYKGVLRWIEDIEAYNCSEMIELKWQSD